LEERKKLGAGGEDEPFVYVRPFRQCHNHGKYECLLRFPAISDPDQAAAKRAFEAMMDMQKIDIAAIEAARRG
jgi:hypothetical protein